MSKLKICISARCFFPKGAFFYSTARMAEMAEAVGYQGIEFLPTWRFVWEMARYGKLLAPRAMVVSGHRDWRQDRVMEAKNTKKSLIYSQVKNNYDWVFPPLSGLCLKALQKFQKLYKVPVSVAWFEDTKNFLPVMLELWSSAQGINQKSLVDWLEKDPATRGVVLDTAKIDSWAISNNLDKKKVMRQLLPFIFEVHYRVKSNILGVDMGKTRGLGELSDETTRNLVDIITMGYKGRIVVEFGWPDLDRSPFGLISQDLDYFTKLHQRLINFISSI